MRTLILVPTRQCNLRCSYCPTVKDGWPELTPVTAVKAITHFAGEGISELKLFGGEPMLAPVVVRAAVEAASADARITRITLCTNGTAATAVWLELLRVSPKLVVALSLDGGRGDHDRFRRTVDGACGSYDAVAASFPDMLRAPRLVVTQVIAPATAARGAENFEHLWSVGFRRFKILPALYLPWSPAQLADLRRSLERIAMRIADAWRRDEYAYVRNLFTVAAVPGFNTAIVVDSDETIYATDAVMTDLPAATRDALRIGTLDAPPAQQAIEGAAAEARRAVQALYPEALRDAAARADAEILRFCRSLYGPLREWRARRADRQRPPFLSSAAT